MMDCADLEISLHRHSLDGYAVEFRYTQPESDTDIRYGFNPPAYFLIDLEKINSLIYDPTAYGEALTQAVFSDPGFRAAFGKVRAASQALNLPLRIRLLIGPSAPELNSLIWETLCDPEDHTPLSTGENVFLSRYLSSLDWRPVRLRPRKSLQALIAVAAPTDLEKYQLAPIDAHQEVQRAEQSLGQIECRRLPTNHEQHLTLANLVETLRAFSSDDCFDILYLVAHGSFVKNEAWLWLEDENGYARRTSGKELVTSLKELKQPPSLVVLASCQSGSTGSGSTGNQALSALGPQLAEAGIPAVVAMLGNLTMETNAAFMPAFFYELQQDGLIDRALAIARGKVRHRPDHWMPALFMRLKSGRIWYVPGFGDEASEFEKWQSLVGFVQEGTCTPILGPGLTEDLLGSPRDYAVRWAEKHGFPYCPEDCDDLPRVAQYISTRQNPAYLRIALREAMREQIIQRYQAAITPDLLALNVWPADKLQKGIELASEARWQKQPNDPYLLLAKMRLPIYVTTNQTNLLAYALTRQGAEPQVRLCPWNSMIPKSKVVYEDEPSPERPLVYHLFGHISDPYSLVISEDEYFDFLIGISRNKDLIPSAVRAALVSTALLFLGFQLDEWSFRIIFRSVMAQEGGSQRMFYSHVAAQLEPEDGRIVDPKRARNYLEKYFETGKISIYWGNTQEFLSELATRMGLA